MIEQLRYRTLRCLLRLEEIQMKRLWCSPAIFAVSVQILTISFSLVSGEVSNVYVSQHKGSDTLSCGTDIHPCKTIVMGVLLAKQHASVYVDGTGTEATPFTCQSSAIKLPGIQANKSLSIIGVHSIVHVKCQEVSYVQLVKSTLETDTIVSVRNIKFINTTIQGQDISLHINQCIFYGATQAVNLIQSTRPLTITFNNSLCENMGSCMAVSVTGQVQPTNKILIDVTNSNIVASGLSRSLAGAIHVTSSIDSQLYSTDPGWMTCDMVLKNVTIQNNTVDSNGLVNVALPNAFTTLHAEDVVFDNNYNPPEVPLLYAMINFAYTSQYVYNHSMFLRNTTFVRNRGLFALPIYVATEDDISMSIFGSRFENNDGIIVVDGHCNNLILFIENTTFVGNRRNLEFECLIYLNDVQKTVSVVIKDSKFENNSCEACSEGMITIATSVASMTITNCIFVSNSAMISIIGAKKSRLTILDTIFIGNASTDANSAAVYVDGYHMTADVLFFNVTFVDYLIVYRGNNDGGALSFRLAAGTIKIESCKFIGNKSPKTSGGAVTFHSRSSDSLIDPGCNGIRKNIDDINEPHRRWTYNVSVLITNTTFVNNSALNGGALALSGGKYTIQNCTFIDNFAHAQGGHIYSTTDSTSLEIVDSTFIQKHSQMIVSHENIYRSSTGLFLYSESEGPLMVFNTTMQSIWSRDMDWKPLIYISKGSFIDFDNQTKVICPRGSSLDILNFIIKVETEYKSKPCKISLILLQFNCKACPIDTYSLQHGHSIGKTKVSGFKCLPCPFGAVCHNKISAKPNYWGYDVKENPAELNFTQCPLGYCNMTDANYFVDYNRCLGNRSGTLCGHCKENYSETLLSTSCCHDNECKDSWLWGVAVPMVMLMALFLIHKPRLSRMLKKQILWFRYSAERSAEEDDDKDNGRGGYLKIVFYFYQVVNIVLVTTSYNNTIKLYLLQPIIGLFNFQFRLSSSGLLCPFRGLTAVTKQLLFASQVFGVVVMIGVIYCCHRVLRMCRSRPPPNLGPYLGAVLEMLLLGYAVFTHTSFQLVRCTSLASADWRLFIDGTVPCYQWWQYVLMVFVGTVAVPFIFTLALGSHWLHKGSISVKEFLIGCVLPLPYLVYKLMSLLRGPHEAKQEPPEWRAVVSKVLYGPFRSSQDNSFGAFYWESILIFRRLILIVIYVFVQDPLSKELLLTFTCVVILSHHIAVQPFRDTAANIVEMISLFCLFTLSSINTFKASFVSFGEVQKGPLTTFEHIVDWIQIIILMALPVLCLLAVLAAIVSQFIRLIIKVFSYIVLACRSRDVLVIDDTDRNLLEPCSSTD